MRSDVLLNVLTEMFPSLRAGKNPESLEKEFDFDPSLKSDEVIGSITQALYFLNNPNLADAIKVGNVTYFTPIPGQKGPGKKNTEPTLLKQLMEKHPKEDAGLVRDLYRRTLARNPTDRELDIALEFVRGNSRNEGFEDLLKAIINTAEFQRRR
jgi:hypothetical protein